MGEHEQLLEWARALAACWKTLLSDHL